MKKSLVLLTLSVLSVFAQSGDPLSTAVRNQYNMAKANLTKSADKMSEADYSFKPTDSVRSFGQLVGHVADANYMFCSSALGESNPNGSSIEKGKSTKADLSAGLKASFDYCDKAYESLTDATAAQMVKFMRGNQPRLGVLTFNNMHDYEHYGNMVTYMRLKNVVPPSSEPRK